MKINKPIKIAFSISVFICLLWWGWPKFQGDAKLNGEANKATTPKSAKVETSPNKEIQRLKKVGEPESSELKMEKASWLEWVGDNCPRFSDRECEMLIAKNGSNAKTYVALAFCGPIEKFSQYIELAMRSSEPNDETWQAFAAMTHSGLSVKERSDKSAALLERFPNDPTIISLRMLWLGKIGKYDDAQKLRDSSNIIQPEVSQTFRGALRLLLVDSYQSVGRPKTSGDLNAVFLTRNDPLGHAIIQNTRRELSDGKLDKNQTASLLMVLQGMQGDKDLAMQSLPLQKELIQLAEDRKFEIDYGMDVISVKNEIDRELDISPIEQDYFRDPAIVLGKFPVEIVSEFLSRSASSGDASALKWLQTKSYE